MRITPISKMRLHLGSGDKHWPGFVNVDMIGGDLKSDVRRLPLNSGCADEIHAIHLFEHLHRMEADDALKEWKRVLKPGGKLALEVPCLEKIAQKIVNGEKSLAQTLFGLYGDVRLNRPEMLHQWCWSAAEIQQALEHCGFADVKILPPFFHCPSRDMRVEAIKL